MIVVEVRAFGSLPRGRVAVRYPTLVVTTDHASLLSLPFNAHLKGRHRMRAILIALVLLVCCACLGAASVGPRLSKVTLSPQERELAALHDTLVELFGEAEAGTGWDNVYLKQKDRTRRRYLDPEAQDRRSVNHLVFSDLYGTDDPARIVYLAATESAVGDLQLTGAEISARMEAKDYPEDQIADFLRVVEIAREAPAMRLDLLKQFLTEKVQGLGNDAQ